MNLPLAVAIAPQATTEFNALTSVIRQADSTAGGELPVRWLVLRDDFVSGADALTVSAWLAPQSEHIELVPEVPVTHNEPFHVSTATATLDFASTGRAGYSPSVQTDASAASAVGRRSAAGADAVWDEAGDVDDVVHRLWASWEPDAVIRDEATGRFIDRDKVHYVDFTGTDSVGEEFTVKGPSITPRPPRGELPVLVRVSDDASARAAARFADVAVLDADAFTDAETGRRLLDAVATGPARPTVLLSVALTEEGRTARGEATASVLSALVDEANELVGVESAAEATDVAGVEGILLDAPTPDAAVAALSGGERAN